MLHRATRSRVAALLGMSLLLCRSTQVSAGSDEDAALLSFPLIISSTLLGAETVVHISRNSDPVGDVALHCYWENATGQCDGGGADCVGDSDCAGGATCLSHWTTSDFVIQPTVGQPLAWRASQGLSALPCSGAGECSESAAGAVPPVATAPFVGGLLCFAVDVNTREPVDRNVFRGEATVEIAVAGGVDVAKSNAVGLRAFEGAVDSDDTLVLGGESPEYEGCPNVNVVNHFYDGASDPVVADSFIATNLSLLPCSQDPASGRPGRSVVALTTINEFEEQMTVPAVIDSYFNRSLSTLSPAFLVGVQGTLTGQTRIRSQAGMFVSGLEAHISSTSGSLRVAAFDVHGQGQRAIADHVGPAPEVCGDGIVRGSEQCDDGNTNDGDCCSSTCQAEADGSTCDDGDECATGDTCLGGSCTAGTPITCPDCGSCFAEGGCFGSCSATIDVKGGAARPGGRACVRAILTNGFKAAARTRNTLTLSSSTGLTLQGCTLNPDLGAGTGPNKVLATATDSPEATTLDVGGNPNPIPDGVLYACEYQVAPGAIGNRSVANNAQAIDAEGFNLVPTGGSDAVIALTDCSSDCDGDGTSTIGELMRCIDHYLGGSLCSVRDAAENCPVADADGNGSVSLGEVSQCVNSFLQDCAP